MDLAVMPEPVVSITLLMVLELSHRGMVPALAWYSNSLAHLQELFIAPKVKTTVPVSESFIHHTITILSRLSQISGAPGFKFKYCRYNLACYYLHKPEGGVHESNVTTRIAIAIIIGVSIPRRLGPWCQ
ncbi:MAG: hypothetical protein IPN46_19895 [Saprospiraceae bacterium]|nr:hypothetical protein [Saprospiraceae bacterium]